ncbi:MAG: hypothetical protein L3K52_05505 [Candidatus Thiothrix sulfatifontis]|nr:MAG: hypothetical protein L3K52_05505 [Candidatus Thiothrix sulfatifontis]
MFELTEDTQPANETVSDDIQAYIEQVMQGSIASSYPIDYLILMLIEEPEQTITPAHVEIISSRHEALAERLAQLVELKTSLQDELTGIQETLSAPRPTYAQLIAQGDIAAADAWEAENLRLRGKQQNINDKLSGFGEAEKLLNKEIFHHARMLGYLNKAVIWEEYKTKMQQFAETFEPLKVSYLACETLYCQVWHNEPRQKNRKHRNQLLTLANIQPELNREYAAGVLKGGLNAELMVVDRIINSKPPFVNPEAAELVMDRLPELHKVIAAKPPIDRRF